MSQKTLDIVRGIAQAAADSYDGALDKNGEPIKLGLRREEGHPINDSRSIDGFKVKVMGDVLTINYQTECTLKEVYSTPFENNMDSALESIKRHLQKKYKEITGNALSLKSMGECEVLVQETSRVRVFALAQKNYKISGMEGVDGGEVSNKSTVYRNPERGDIEKSFKDFLELKSDKRPENDKRKD